MQLSPQLGGCVTEERGLQLTQVEAGFMSRKSGGCGMIHHRRGSLI